MSFETLGGLLSSLNELSGAVSELSRIRWDADGFAWVGRNYRRSLRVSKLISQSFPSICMCVVYALVSIIFFL